MSHGRIAFLLVLLLGAGVVLDQLLRFGLVELRRWRRRRRVFAKPSRVDSVAYIYKDYYSDSARVDEDLALPATVQLATQRSSHDGWPPWPRVDPARTGFAFEDEPTAELAPPGVISNDSARWLLRHPALENELPSHSPDDFAEEAPTEPRLRATGTE